MIAWPVVALLITAALVVGACLGLTDAFWMLRRERHRRVLVDFTSPESRRALNEAMGMEIRDELHRHPSNVVRIR